MSSIESCKFHRIALKSLHQRFGCLNETEVINEIMQEINRSELHEFQTLSTKYRTKPGDNGEDENKGFGFNMHTWYQTEWVPNRFLAMFGVKEFDRVNNVIQFYEKPGFLFAITYGSYWTRIEPFCCQKFPVEANLFNINDNEEWTTVPLTSPMSRLKALTGGIKNEIKMATGNGYIKFNLGNHFDVNDVPEILNYFANNCELSD